ncbi:MULTISPECIES: RluA family pseudouridine synthase [unclassified Cytobacillus]|uniref:RluA family pseudouridine synthase n=1 Tax=unclassified Cytobacillus TaxID=2675268 RepID=UPI00135C8640|nr:RluA family pseudouridine synthase [Cytobacillus sp. AMY 15.2]KAF0815631.1 putative pseudouridine synthase D [Bacillus sp. ZZV12-4809]MCM3093904.1 RluA family pseudouridine synthase [Cytobacillus sp. AMY 15.2]
MVKIQRFGEWCEIEVPARWEGYSIDYIFRTLWGAPKKQTHNMRMKKQVLYNNEPANWTNPVHAGDKLKFHFFVDEDPGVIPSYYEVDVLFEDDHMLVLNKPAGMDTHPNSPDQMNTLANAAAFHMQMQGEYRAIKHIHRLDRDTTGAILFAKHALAGAILDKELQERRIKRTYLALVHGEMSKNKGTIREPIGRDRHHPTRRRVSPGGQPAATNYEIIEYFRKQNLSLIKCRLDTGRTHQIRVHLSCIGHPLAGDTLYGGKPVFARQALHAVKMEIPHPFSEEAIVCHAPFLDDPGIFKAIDPYRF